MRPIKSRRGLLSTALTIGIIVGIPVSYCGCAPDNDEMLEAMRPSILIGDIARKRIVNGGNRLNGQPARNPLPESATNFYAYEGGSVFGSIEYWSFECSTLDECWEAIEMLGPSQIDMKEWKPSRYAVVMKGPEFYSRVDATSLWDVRTIKNGVVYERVDENVYADGHKHEHERMYYYAIDFDRLRIYHHYESGGFPADEYHQEK